MDGKAFGYEGISFSAYTYPGIFLTSHPDIPLAWATAVPSWLRGLWFFAPLPGLGSSSGTAFPGKSMSLGRQVAPSLARDGVVMSRSDKSLWVGCL